MVIYHFVEPTVLEVDDIQCVDKLKSAVKKKEVRDSTLKLVEDLKRSYVPT